MFCSKCGKEIQSDSNFCMGCGAPVGTQINNTTNSNAQDANTTQSYSTNNFKSVQGMRTTQEMLDFLNQHHLASVESPKHVPLIEQSLMPNEVVLFIFCGNQNSQGLNSQGIHAYALTNKRFLISQAKVMFQKGNLRGVEAFTYDQIGGVMYNKNLLTGNISITTFTGTVNIMVGKKEVEYIYNSVNKVLYDVRNNI